MRALKVLVVLMGILLVVGFSVLGVMITRKLNGPNQAKSSSPSQMFLPAGFKIQNIQGVGGSLVIYAKSTKAEHVLIIDPQSGDEIARLTSSQSNN